MEVLAKTEIAMVVSLQDGHQNLLETTSCLNTEVNLCVDARTIFWRFFCLWLALHHHLLVCLNAAIVVEHSANRIGYIGLSSNDDHETYERYG